MAAGAVRAMEAVLIDHRDDRRHLGDLVTARLGVVALQGLMRGAALGRLAVDEVAELLGSSERTNLGAMTGLAASLSCRRGEPEGVA